MELKEGYHRIPVSDIGIGRGIEGSANSCYLDTLFMSLFYSFDDLDNVFRLEERDRDESALRDRLRWTITQLREKRFLPAEKCEPLRRLISKLDKNLKEGEMSDVSHLLTTLCGRNGLALEAFIRYKSSSSFFHQILTFQGKGTIPIGDLEAMLKESLSIQRLEIRDLNERIFILKMPRSNGELIGFEGILPPLTICVPVGKEERRMKLRSVICLKHLHFTCFIRKRGRERTWLYFDSMGPKGAEVKVDSEVERMLKKPENYPTKELLKHHLIRNVHMCIYVGVAEGRLGKSNGSVLRRETSSEIPLSLQKEWPVTNSSVRESVVSARVAKKQPEIFRNNKPDQSEGKERLAESEHHEVSKELLVDKEKIETDKGFYSSAGKIHYRPSVKKLTNRFEDKSLPISKSTVTPEGANYDVATGDWKDKQHSDWALHLMALNYALWKHTDIFDPLLKNANGLGNAVSLVKNVFQDRIREKGFPDPEREYDDLFPNGTAGNYTTFFEFVRFPAMLNYHTSAKDCYYCPKDNSKFKDVQEIWQNSMQSDGSSLKDLPNPVLILIRNDARWKSKGLVIPNKVLNMKPAEYHLRGHQLDLIAVLSKSEDRHNAYVFSSKEDVWKHYTAGRQNEEDVPHFASRLGTTIPQPGIFDIDTERHYKNICEGGYMWIYKPKKKKNLKDFV